MVAGSIAAVAVVVTNSSYARGHVTGAEAAFISGSLLVIFVGMYLWARYG